MTTFGSDKTSDLWLSFLGSLLDLKLGLVSWFDLTCMLA